MFDRPFKVGDKVKPKGNFGKYMPSRSYTITEIHQGFVYLDHDSGGWYPHRIELVTPVPESVTPEELVAEYKGHVTEWIRHKNKAEMVAAKLKEQGWTASFAGTSDAFFSKVTTERLPSKR